MGHDEDQNTQDSSRVTLNALNTAQKQVVMSTRPPLWITLCLAMVAAILTLTMYYPGDSAMRKVVWISVIILGNVTWAFWYYRLRKRGIKVRTLPRSFSGKMFVFGFGAFILLVIIVAAAFLGQGVQSAPYVAALVNGIIVALLTHHYPTGEWRRKEGRA